MNSAVMKLLSIFLMVKIIYSCGPLISSPVIPSLALNPVSIASSPQLPPIAFQIDQALPQSVDYVDEPVAVQKDSIIPLNNEKFKNRFSLFDMFRPLAQSATTRPILIKEKSVDNISLNISFSPPVHWTYCVPSCGVSDQAVDSDDAYEKAKDDVVEAVQSSCTQLGVECITSSIDLQYNPESVLTEDFGAYFDLSGNRYKISGRTIPYRISNLNPGIIHSFILPMKINFKLSSSVSEATAKAIRQKVVNYLAARKFVHISTDTI